MITKYTHKALKVEISVREIRKHSIAWSEFRHGRYKGTKVLPKSNTAIIQNFGWSDDDATEFAAA